MDKITERDTRLTRQMEDTRFWAEIASDSRDALLDWSDVRDYEANAPIEMELGLVVSGTIGLEYRLNDGRRSITELFHSGDLINVRREDRTPEGRLVALSYACVLSLDLEDFRKVAAVHRDIAAAYRRQMADQVGRLRDHVHDLAAKTPLERIVSVLFELRRRRASDGEDVAEVALPLLRKDIAAYAGVKPETLSRALRQLKEARLIAETSAATETITMLDAQRLREIANGGAPRSKRKSQ